MPPNAGAESVAPVQQAKEKTEKPAEKSGMNPKWRPWPWNLVPDWACVATSIILLLPVAPPMAILIGVGEVVWNSLLYLATKTTLHIKFRDAIMSVSQKVANHIMIDPRNAPYLPHLVWLSFWAPFVFFLALYRYMNHGFEFWFFLVIQFMRMGPRFRFFTYNHVLLHKEGHDHKGFFKKPFNIFNQVVNWWIGPFYGGVPNSYCMSHNKIHHRYDNDLDDVHTNLDLDRSKASSFLLYLPRFALYWNGLSPLAFFIKNREYKFAAQVLIGMLAWFGVFGLFLAKIPVFALTYIWYPQIESYLFFGLISYLWHAFLDPEHPENQFVNSVTVLRGKDNVFNEDYHVVHHTAPHVHWTDYPAYYEKTIDEYKKAKATIFADTEEGELIALLLAGNWKKLAELYVDLEGKMTVEEKEALILKRLRSTICGYTYGIKQE